MDLQVAAKHQQGYGRLLELLPADDELEFSYGLKAAIFRASKHAKASEVGAVEGSAVGDTEAKYLVIVLPGGGYEFLSYLEDRKVALAFAERGFDALVLHYHTKYVEEVIFSGKGIGHEAMVDVAQVIDAVRSNPKLGLCDRKIVLCGFSAGGHLAASMCTLFDSPELIQGAAWNSSLRPDGAILCYPVISASSDLAHATTFTCFTGSQDPEKWQPFSCERNVTAKTPPAFIWHTVDDDTVPFGNSIAYAQALWQQGINAQLVLFPKGIHGASLGTPEVEINNDFAYADPLIATWLEQAVIFVRQYV